MQWSQLGGGMGAPKISKMIYFFKFYWFYWFNVQYVHACQDLVPFSTWIDFNIGGDDTRFLAWLRKKKISYVIKIPPPRNLWIGVTVQMSLLYMHLFLRTFYNEPLYMYVSIHAGTRVIVSMQVIYYMNMEYDILSDTACQDSNSPPVPSKSVWLGVYMPYMHCISSCLERKLKC